MKIRFSVNKHGQLFKVVNHPNGDVVMLAQHQGEFARWDDGDGIGYVRHGSGALGRIADREKWQVAVKITASLMRGK
jgi:hypothetical protein